MLDYKKALNDPASVFKTPEDVVRCEELSKKQKIKILHSWEYDAREMQVAEEENMQAPSQSDLLAMVLSALLELGEKSSQEHIAPTKQGGD